MDRDLSYILRGVAVGVVAALLVVMFTYPLPQGNDYYISHVSILFQQPYVVEDITFHVVEGGTFKEYFKLYYGEREHIEKVECSHGTPQIRDAEGDVEIACVSNAPLPPGDYKLRITYKPPIDWDYVKWVAFSYVDRPIERITSNGEVGFPSSHFREPAVAYWPKREAADAIRDATLEAVLLFPYAFPFLLAAFSFYLYYRYGREFDVGVVPDTFHDVPNKERSPVDVALFLHKYPQLRVKEAVSSAVALAIVKGVAEMEGDVLRVKGKLEELPPIEGQIVKLLNGKNLKNLDEGTAATVARIVKEYYNKGAVLYLDNKGIKILTWLMALFVILFIIPLDLFIIPSLFPHVEGVWGGWHFSLLAGGLAYTIAFLALQGYGLQRYNEKEIYREKLLWDAFGKLLREESLIKQYGPKDKAMWGLWLVYAYAMGLPKKIVELLGERAGIPHATAIYAAGVRVKRLSKPKGRGSGHSFRLGGGYVGGGRFGMR